MEPTCVEDFRQNMTERLANCLMGDLERGARVATYRALRTLAGINLVVNCDLGGLSKQVEYALNTLTTKHQNHKLRANYKVTLNTINGHLLFAAYVRSA